MNLPPEVVEPIVKKIIKDLKDRKGLRQAWDEIDPETQQDIKDEWSVIIIKERKDR